MKEFYDPGAPIRAACVDGETPQYTRQESRRKGETQGFMKVPVDGDSKEILGANVLGTGGDDVIHCVLDLMCTRAPYSVMQRAVPIHPTTLDLVMVAEHRGN